MRRVLPAVCLVVLGGLAVPVGAQQPQLRVVVVEGEDALNNTQAGANRDVTVEVRGPDQMPVSGATVTFVLPDSGASGTFPNGQRTLMVDTNNQGRATASGIRTNSIAGPMQIRVSASYLGVIATAVVRQTNVAVAVVEPPKPTAAKPAPAKETSTAATRPSPAGTTTPAPKKPGMSKTAKLVLVLAIAGGAAAGGIAVGGKGSSSSSTPGTPSTTTIGITPGTPTVGGQ